MAVSQRLKIRPPLYNLGYHRYYLAFNFLTWPFSTLGFQNRLLLKNFKQL